jgi:hypothetical protein
VKNEILVYHDAIPKDSKLIDPAEGTFYNMSGNQQPELDLLQYDEIYMDFNGSMAFFNDKWRARLSNPSVARKVRLALLSRIVNMNCLDSNKVCFTPCSERHSKLSTCWKLAKLPLLSLHH